MRLYLRARQRADSLNLSFAGYVTDLVAKDLATLPDTGAIPDVRRVKHLQFGDQKSSAKQTQELSHQAMMSGLPSDSPLRDLREVHGKLRSKKKAI